LFSCGCCNPVRLGEQLADFLCIQRRRQHGSKLAFTGGPPWGGTTQPSLRLLVSVGGWFSRSATVCVGSGESSWERGCTSVLSSNCCVCSKVTVSP
jgi:hypothetical protein